MHTYLNIFLCAQGHTWQIIWMSVCIVNVFIDGVITETFRNMFLEFLLPSAVAPEVRGARSILAQTIQQFLLQDQQQGLPPSGHSTSWEEPHKSTAINMKKAKFSCSDYFFVSTFVARAYPDLIESRIIAAYRNPLLLKTNTLRRLLDPSFYALPLWHRMASVVSLNVILVWLGSQNDLVQVGVVNAVNAGIIVAVAAVVAEVRRHFILGVSCAAAAAMVVVVRLFLYRRETVKVEGKKHRQVRPLADFEAHAYTRYSRGGARGSRAQQLVLDDSSGDIDDDDDGDSNIDASEGADGRGTNGSPFRAQKNNNHNGIDTPLSDMSEPLLLSSSSEEWSDVHGNSYRDFLVSRGFEKSPQAGSGASGAAINIDQSSVESGYGTRSDRDRGAEGSDDGSDGQLVISSDSEEAGASKGVRGLGKHQAELSSFPPAFIRRMAHKIESKVNTASHEHEYDEQLVLEDVDYEQQAQSNSIVVSGAAPQDSTAGSADLHENDLQELVLSSDEGETDEY